MAETKDLLPTGMSSRYSGSDPSRGTRFLRRWGAGYTASAISRLTLKRSGSVKVIWPGVPKGD
jgi:hypothetical protein